MKTFYLLILVMLLISCNNQADDNANSTNTFETDSAGYARYVNGRFGFRVDFPKKILIAQEEADNSDGRRFTDKNGNEIFIVYGSTFDTLTTRYKEDLRALANNPNKTFISYQEITPTRSIISARNNDSIFYYKRIKTDEGIVSLIAAYKRADSAKYFSSIGSVSNSLKEIKVDREEK